MTVSDESAADVERRKRRRQQRLEILAQLEEDTGPLPFRLTLAGARAKWPEWEAAHNERRAAGRRAATEKFGPAVADFLVKVRLPELPPPTEVVVYALELECGHEAFSLARRSDSSPPTPERARCPIFWSCQLSDGRTAVRYVEPGEPRSQDAEFGLTRWSVTLACGHTAEILRAAGEGSRVGDFMVCRGCGRDDPDFDVEIVALGERLPDLMVQDWKVELSCGHLGTDHFIPVKYQDDPAAYRMQHPRRRGLRCIDAACDERLVRAVRRLGVVGKIRKPAPAPPVVDPVTVAARDLRRRLTKEERVALISELQRDDEPADPPAR